MNQTINKEINIKTIEQQTYKFTLQDGLYDIAYATLLISFALAPLLREHIYLGYIPFLIIPAPLIILLGKRYITQPRIGIVKFGQQRKQRQKKMILISSILIPITIILVLLTALGLFGITTGNILGGYAIPIGAAIFAIFITGLAAYLIQFPNLLIYGTAIGIGILVSELLQTPIGEPLNGIIAFGISGTVLLIIGLVILNRFIKKYPLPDEETTHAR